MSKISDSLSKSIEANSDIWKQFVESDLKLQRMTISKHRRVVRNRCQCSVCLDIIESKGRHNFVQCQCGRIFTDGGLDYVRRGCMEANDIIDLTEYEEIDP